MEFECKITDISDVMYVGAKETKKVTFLAEEVNPKSEYPDSAAFEVYGDEKVDQFLRDHKEGDPVRVSFNLRGREHNGKHYVNLQAWSVKSLRTEPTKDF